MFYSIRKSRNNNWMLCYWSKVWYRFVGWAPFQLNVWVPLFVDPSLDAVMTKASELGIHQYDFMSKAGYGHWPPAVLRNQVQEQVMAC